MSELTGILHKILHVAAGEDGDKGLHDEIDALDAPAPEAPAPAPDATDAAAPEVAGEPVPDAEPAAQEPAQAFGSESDPEASNGE